MYTKEDLIKQLNEMGLLSTDNVLMHSSMKKIGDVQNRADGVLDALMEYFDEGLLILPTHTWDTIDLENNLFDTSNEPVCVGILPELFRKRANVYRSLHPTHSVGAYGKNAKTYIKGEEDGLTPANPKGLWGRLPEIDAKILLVGVDHGRNTFIHSIEEMMDVPNRFTENKILFEIKDGDKTIEREFYKHETPGMPSLSDNYQKAGKLLIDKGIVKEYKFGDADVLLMDAYELMVFIKEMLKIDIDVFSTRDDLDIEKYQHLERIIK